MNFSRAFKYPFQNFAKVMSIVLALTIAFAVFIAIILNSYDWSPLFESLYGLETPAAVDHMSEPFSGSTVLGVFGLLVVALVSGFWISGYSVEVIRSVMRDEEWMPPIDFGRNVKDGAYLFLSSVAYWMLFIALIFIVAIVHGVIGGIVTLALAIITVGMTCVMGWAYFVGMARFAAEGDHRAALQIWRNMRVARNNWGKGLTLLLYMIAFSIIYGAVRSIVDGVFGGLMSLNLLAGITLSIIIYYIFNLMQHFSTQVLIAQYATEIGIRSDHYDPEKDKVKLDFTQE
ncbi:MAG: DUF4013 domain-containing protein [Chloroflexota bacterium]|nr:DUF4013 domain-containing protein [Chloroflexota bacterium]